MEKNFKRAALITLPMSLAMPGTWKGSGKYKYYVDSRGKKVTRLKKIGKKYYFRRAGYAATRLIKIGKRYYYFGSKGVMVKAVWKPLIRADIIFLKLVIQLRVWLQSVRVRICLNQTESSVGLIW